MTGPILPMPGKASGTSSDPVTAHRSLALREAARNVLRLARQQESVVPREIRQEVARAGLPD